MFAVDMVDIIRALQFERKNYASFFILIDTDSTPEQRIGRKKAGKSIQLSIYRWRESIAKNAAER
jgi:hypothetical protein